MPVLSGPVGCLYVHTMWCWRMAVFPHPDSLMTELHGVIECPACCLPVRAAAVNAKAQLGVECARNITVCDTLSAYLLMRLFARQELHASQEPPIGTS